MKFFESNPTLLSIPQPSGDAMKISVEWFGKLNEVALAQLQYCQKQIEFGVDQYWAWLALWANAGALGAKVEKRARKHTRAVPNRESRVTSRPATAPEKPVLVASQPQGKQSTVAEVAASSDDLTVINGIGPAIAKKLNARDITSLAQIANLTEADVAELEKDVIKFSGRILREDWIGQAKALVAAR